MIEETQTIIINAKSKLEFIDRNFNEGKFKSALREMQNLQSDVSKLDSNLSDLICTIGDDK